jgi:hypothetical protein
VIIALVAARTWECRAIGKNGVSRNAFMTSALDRRGRGFIIRLWEREECFDDQKSHRGTDSSERIIFMGILDVWAGRNPARADAAARDQS